MSRVGHLWNGPLKGSGGYICNRCGAGCARGQATPEFLAFMPKDMINAAVGAMGHSAIYVRYSCEEIQAMKVMLS
jgi:hypothetical protein